MVKIKEKFNMEPINNQKAAEDQIIFWLAATLGVMPKVWRNSPAKKAWRLGVVMFGQVVLGSIMSMIIAGYLVHTGNLIGHWAWSLGGLVLLVTDLFFFMYASIHKMPNDVAYQWLAIGHQINHLTLFVTALALLFFLL